MQRISFRALLLTALLALAAGSSGALAGSVQIRDEASVLSASDRQNIQQATRPAPFDVTVWTVRGGFPNNRAGFRQAADQMVGSNQVVIAVDTVDRFSDVAERRNTGLSPAQAQAARAAARDSFGSGDWGRGVMASLDTLVQSAPRGGRSYSQPAHQPQGSYAPNDSSRPAPENNSGGGSGFGGILMIVVVVGLLVMLARKFMGGGAQPGMGGGFGPFGRTRYGSGMNQGMNPGGYGQGYGPGYGPNQGGGANPLLTGGLGALGGGLLGYELGKNAGEREGQQVPNQGGQDFNNSNNDPGGVIDADAGDTSNAPDFGSTDSGGADFGGSDFGGGDAGGGGSDF